MASYDTIIYGGSLYAGGIIGIKLTKENINKLKDKNFTKEQQKDIKFLYLRRGFNYSKLNPFDKFLMILLKCKVKKQKGRRINK